MSAAARRRTVRWPWTIATALGLLVLVLAACTGDDQETPPEPPDNAGGAGASEPEDPEPEPGPEPEPDGDADNKSVAVSVYFHNTERSDDPADVDPRPRTVTGPAVLRGALEELLRGPTDAEHAEGDRSWFSTDTAGMLRSVRIEDGTAFVDFEDFSRVVPGASSSAGSATLLAELEATTTQFPSVERARFAFEGDERAFSEWLQRDVPN